MATEDRTVHPDLERFAAKRMGAMTVELKSSHAAVVYHGGDTEKYLGEVNGLDAPLLMHLAGEDEFISKPAQAEIKAAFRSKPNATIYSYPGQRHAFAWHNGANYSATAAALANQGTSDFLHQQLR